MYNVLFDCKNMYTILTNDFLCNRFFFHWRTILHNEILYVLKPVSELCSKFFTKVSWQRFSCSLPFHFYEIYFDNTHARTFLLVFFRFQDVCFRFVFQSIKMMYPLGTIPFPSLWRHQMKCLLIGERIFF